MSPSLPEIPSRDLPPSVRLEQFLARIEAQNPEINAFVTITAELAQEQAAAADRRAAAGQRLSAIDGWCIAVKDNIDVAGVRTTNGLPLDKIAESDAAVVSRLRQAGAVILGKTNLHEAALGTTTNNPHWGPTHNPHRHGYTAGGSSGGSAAAVAAGFCDAALGTDTMGSVRLPASYCGVVGFKPTFDLLPVDGVAPLCWSLDHVGPLARDVTDAGMMMEALAALPAAASDFREPRVVRLSSFETEPLEPAVADAYLRAVQAVQKRVGVCPVIDTPWLDPVALRRAALLVIEADAACIHADTGESASPELRAMLDYGTAMPAVKLAAARETLRQAQRQIDRLLGAYEIIISPVSPQTAFAFTERVPASQANFLGLAVFAGAPALSLPIVSDDMPVGLQLIAARNNDRQILDWAEYFCAQVLQP